MATQPTEKPLCFVIGPIGEAGSEVRRHADFLLLGIVRPVLEAEEFGYRVKRADEDPYPGMISDRMISDIMNSDLVVADLTGLNANALYELGIRHSRERPAIHIATVETKLPFDNQQHAAILVDMTDWRSIEEARSRLAASARAIKAPDYRVSNPITQANASFKMRTSADPNERVIADLQERVVTLEERQARVGAVGRRAAEMIAASRTRYPLNPYTAYGALRGLGEGGFSDPFAGTGGFGDPNALIGESILKKKD